MKLIYTSENQFLVRNAKNILENNGVATTLKNVFSSGGSGELPAQETWPELWLLDDTDHEKAQSLLAPLSNQEEQPDWRCEHCHEMNAASFEFCWNCQAEAGSKPA